MEQEALGKILHQIRLNNQKQVNHQMKDLDLSMTQSIGLLWLDEADGNELPIKTMEKMYETAQPTTLGVINRLEQKNLVTTYLTEKRKKMVKITPEGLELVGSIRQRIEQVESTYFHNFSSGERTIFLELLQKLKQNISQYQTIDVTQEKESEDG